MSVKGQSKGEIISSKVGENFLRIMQSCVEVYGVVLCGKKRKERSQENRKESHPEVSLSLYVR